MALARSEFIHTLLLGTTCLASLAIAWPAYAGGPTGATVVSGSATVSNPNASSTVINQKSEKALINWQDFSIPKGDSVTFNQPNSAAIALNRVTGPNASSIYGDLLANGNVWLINSNGILFGKGSKINVGSLIATTSDISNQDFASGNYNFSGASNNPNASVINQGTITTAKGGSAVLSAPSVSNSGIIQADVGNVVLGGEPAFSVDFDGDNLLRYAVISPTPQTAAGAPAKAAVSNSGTISANGGTVLMTARAASSVTDAVVNNTGIIEATSVSSHDGEIILDAGDGTANVGGTLDASGTGAGQTGGAISVTGKQVNVGDGATINASGNAGGGTILIGGGFHGAGTIANAQTTTVGRATITADALASGDGGKVAIWSDQNTQFAGTISAKGGAKGGNGGFVETSGGQLHIVDGAAVVTSAPKGTTGTWLLDPANIIVGPGPRGGTSTLDNGVLSLTTDPGATDTITSQSIIAALQGGTDVTLEASNNITVKDDLIYNASNKLSLLAEQDIDVFANVQNSGSGALNLIAGWDGTTLPASSLTASGVFGNNGGQVVIGGTGATGDVAVGSASGITTIAAASLLLEADNGYAQLGFHGAGGGAIDVFTTGDATLTAGTAGSHYAQIGNGAVQGAPSGDVSGDIALRLGGVLDLADQTENGGGAAWLGNVAASGSNETGNVTLVAKNIINNVSFSGNIAADLGSGASGGNVTIGLTDTAATVISGHLFYSSSNALTILVGGDLDLEGATQNTGTGNLNIVAGWDGVTLDPASLTDAGVFGNGGHGITIGGANAAGGVAVGSAGGTTTLAGDSITLSASNGFAQVGYRGAGGGNIDVVSLGDIALTGGAQPADYAQIGNGAADGSVSGGITGDLNLIAGGTLTIAATADGGRAWLGNFAASDSAETGNVTLVAKDENNNGDAIDDLASIIGGDIMGGNVLIGLTDAENTLTLSHYIAYNSAYTLSLLDAGDLVFDGSLQNSGSGALNLVAGWDGFTLDPASLTHAGVYGNNGGSIQIGGSGATGDVAVGSAGGLTTLAASNLSLDGTNGFAQLGYHGAGGGDIDVLLNGSLNMAGSGGEGSGDFAQIGNGDLTGRTQGDVTGNITVNVAGASQFSTGNSNGGGLAWLGNSAGLGLAETGDVNFTAQTLTLYNEDAGQFLGSDLTGGNVTLALTGAGSALTLASTIDVTSSYALTLLVGGNVDFNASVQNSGSGNITVLAGWDGFTFDPSKFTNAGVFGNNDANLTIGGNAAFGDVALGGNGTVLVEASTIDLDAQNGYAQIGYHGAGGGTVTVASLSDITLTGGGQTSDFAQIGNGSLDMDVEGAVSGSTNVTAGGTIALNANTDGGGATAIANSGTSGSGDVSIFANGVTGDIGTSLAAGLPLGDFFLASTGPDTLTIATAANYNNGSTLTLLNGGDITFDASVQNAGGGNITVLAGWDGFTLDPSQFTNPGVFGNNDANLTIGGNAAFGDVALGGNGTLLVEANTINLDAENGYAQIGYHGAGGGAVTVASLGDMTLNGGGGTADFAQIGNGSLDMDVEGAVSGSTNVTAGGTIALNANTDGGGATAIANSGTSGSGDVSIFANGVTGDIGTSLAAGLPLGDFLLASSGTDTLTIATAENYNNGSTLTLLNGGDIVFDASVQNAGSGNIIALAGWDGFTLDPSQFTNPGVYGNNGANLTVGGMNATGAVSVGSNTGQTLIEGGNITIDAEANNAQIGYAGAGSGNIDVFARGNILVEASDANAQIGNGISGSSGNISGDILVNAGGDLTLSGASLIGNQTGAEITESGNVAIASQTFGGDIDPSLTNDLPGGNFSLAVAGNSPLIIDAALNYDSGNTLSLSTGGDLTVEQSIQNAGFGAINLASGGTLTIGGEGALTDVAVGSAQGTTTIAAGNLSLDAENGFAQLGYHGAGGGDIFATIGNNLTLTGGADAADTAQIGNGSLSDDIDGAATGNISVQAGGTSDFNAAADGGTVFFGNASISGETGNDTLIGGSLTAENVDLLTNLVSNITGGDVFAQFTNQSTALTFSHAVNYDSAHSLTLITSGDLVFDGSFENSGSGAIALGGANITIGGDGAVGNINVGSMGGLTSVTGNSLTLDASQGYAQLGLAAGSGSIDVNVTGDLALIGGSGDGQYAQIGNGGLQTSGNNSGAISVAAGGNLSLNGGAGKESYAQIGHGGAESNSNSNGYSNVGTVTVSGAQIALNSGSGVAAYSQIGNGGFEAGNLLTGGTATNSGDITVNASQSVTLLSNGQDAYAQIGNGGDQVNLGASADAHGVISGIINVSAPNGSGAVTLTAGPGQNAYTQIGNGGYADNKSDFAVAANFSDTGSVTVADLSLNGGDVGSNGYAQIGNGDASGNSISNVSGDITLIANGQVTTINGTAPNSPATIGNATGSGTVTGTVTGLPVIPPPSPPVGSDAQTIGVIASLTASSSTPTSDNNVVVVTPEQTEEASTQPAGQTNPAATSSSASSPIAEMSGEGETATASDTATASLGQSLTPGSTKPGAPAATRTLISGVLRQVVPGAATHTPRGVPPANQDVSSWGNEALWQ